MQVIRSDIHRRHHCAELDGGKIIDSWEHPGRADMVDRATDEVDMAVSPPAVLDRRLLESVHDPGYLAFLETAWTRWVDAGHTTACAMAFTWPARRMTGPAPTTIDGLLGHHSFAADCSIGAHTWPAAAESAAIAQTAADRAVDAASAVFARCRPPGHHASRDQFGGYCYLNNAAVVAQRLRDRGHDKVAILDIDYHHGNGTQDIFYEREDVVFASLHADPRREFPYFLGHADETGRGDGAGANLNLPLPHGTGASDWLAALDTALGWITDAAPTAAVVSLGVDTYHDDPISRFTLATDDFPEVGRRLRRLPDPVVFVLEGGYATEQLGVNVVGVLRGFEPG